MTGFFFNLLLLFAGNNSTELTWGGDVMGGPGESSFQIDQRGSEIGGPTGVFKGCSCQTFPPMSFHGLFSCT